ncbi:MAG: hypothetical protein LUD12_14370 [Lachnospiraceae bacterium]|nr:hypothetical protein [Lachnospiraceae bacterium]
MSRYEIRLTKYVACICEGSAESAVIERLLQEDKLIFTNKNLLDNEIIRRTNSKDFEMKYLSREFSEKVTILRILDSRREKFKISKAYENKVGSVINIITAPEIEMLIVLSEGRYDDFKKSKMKPSDYCKVVLKMKRVKTYNFVMNYFSDVDKLINAINEYHRISYIHVDEYCLYDLLKYNHTS